MMSCMMIAYVASKIGTLVYDKGIYDAGIYDKGICDDRENKPVWSTWAVGVLSGVRDVETYKRGRPA